MKCFAMLSMFCIVFSVSPSQAEDDEQQKTFEDSISFKPVEALRLENLNGKIEVRTWEREEVRVRALIKATGRYTEEVEEILGALKIRIEQTDNRLEIYSDHPRKEWGWGRSLSVSYELTVPKRIDLDLNTTNGSIEIGTVEGKIGANTTNGSIYIGTVEGQLRANTTNGNVEIDGVQGSVSVRTTNGGIDVELTSSDGSEDLLYTTTNGSINISLPGDIKGNFEAKTTNGHIETDFPISVRGKISGKTVKGDLNGGGDTNISIKTTNGSIYIRQAA